MMKRVLKWLGVCANVLIAVMLIAATYVYAASEWEINRYYEKPAAAALELPTDAAALEEGKRLATVHGCNNSCHGSDMQGLAVFDKPGIARIVSPNLTRVAKDYSVAELEAVIRHGIKRDGTSTWMIPSAMYSNLSDADLAKIVAYVRSVPVREGPRAEVELRAFGRICVVTKRFVPAVRQVHKQPRRMATPDDSNTIDRGRYLVMTACTECHGMNLEGWAFIGAPSLVVAAAYPYEDFARLMKTGIALGDRELGLMGGVARSRFTSFKEEELRAMHTFLTTRTVALAH